ncbi:MAG: 1-deoxy-D-xylulose-5-phosphate synthase [Planctomycetes bacterium]|nr:1-deoxy-D-xylulose-5-phosphate synthase [Planctomycetota bacterium]
MARILDGVNSPADLKPLSPEQLKQLAQEIRDEIELVTHQTGGHLGSALGVVELTLALHRTFDFANDRLIWDVSHQVYPHKLVTGRRDRFRTLRQFGGLSGFACPAESPYDVYMFGHAGTAVSTALGVLCGDGHAGRERKVVAVVGDGSMTAGVAYEGLNNTGWLKKNLLVILNDNRWSISQTVGALSTYLDRIRSAQIYRDAKAELKHLIERLPLVGQPMEKVLETVAHGVKQTIKGVNIFEELGFDYYGPVDGHDLEAVEKALAQVKNLNKPVLLHVLTEKGHGHPGAETDSQRAHAAKVGATPALKLASPTPAKEAADTGCKIEPPSPPKSSKTYTQVFAESLIELARTDKRVIAVNAAMPEGTGLSRFEKEFPARYYDVGICEQHAVAFASGLALAGNRPVAAIYSTFLQRAFDQIMHEVCLNANPVLFCLDRGGIAGDDGPTHHGVFDIAYTRIFPRMCVAAPKDGHELFRMMEWALKQDSSVALRYPRASVPDGELPLFRKDIRLGEAEWLAEGKHGALLAYGAMVYPALEAARKLAAQGLELTVVNARFAKPVDEDTVQKLAADHPFVLTLEDHVLQAGFGSAVLEAAISCGADARRFVRLGIPDRFVEHGARPKLLETLGLDAAGIARSAQKCAERAVKSS